MGEAGGGGKQECESREEDIGGRTWKEKAGRKNRGKRRGTEGWLDDLGRTGELI